MNDVEYELLITSLLSIQLDKLLELKKYKNKRINLTTIKKINGKIIKTQKIAEKLPKRIKNIMLEKRKSDFILEDIKYNIHYKTKFIIRNIVFNFDNIKNNKKQGNYYFFNKGYNSLVFSVKTANLKGKKKVYIIIFR